MKWETGTNGYFLQLGTLLLWCEKIRKKLKSGQVYCFSKVTAWKQEEWGDKESSPELFPTFLALGSLNPLVCSIMPV